MRSLVIALFAVIAFPAAAGEKSIPLEAKPSSISPDAKDLASDTPVDLSGVYALYVSGTELSPEAQIGSAEWASVFIRFESTAPSTYKGQWYHPTIPGRAPPACAFSSDFEMTAYASTHASGFDYPAVTIVQSGNVVCDGTPGTAFQTWAGNARPAGTGFSEKSIEGQLASNNGNRLNFILLHQPDL